MVFGFVLRRLVGLATVLLGLTFLIFALLVLSPGSTVQSLLGSRPRNPETVRAITHQYGLDQPFLVQYWHWLARVGHGDLGRSIDSGQTVTSLISERLSVTLELGGLAFIMVILVGLPLGFLAGVRRGGQIDRLTSALSIVSLSAPTFAVGIVLIYVFGVKLNWLPVYGAGVGFSDRLTHILLPAITLAIGLAAVVVRQTRASVCDVMDRDYVTFARARGLPTWRILGPYAMRNSSLPIITSVGLLAIGAVAGTVLAETVYAVPGLGSLMTHAIQVKDIPVAQGVALVFAAAVVSINVVVDVFVLVLDPRTRQGS